MLLYHTSLAEALESLRGNVVRPPGVDVRRADRVDGVDDNRRRRRLPLSDNTARVAAGWRLWTHPIPTTSFTTEARFHALGGTCWHHG